MRRFWRYKIGAGLLFLLLLVAAAVGAQDAWHRVAAGESLESIARRYGVTEADIARRNGLAGASTIREGQFLLIPLPAATPTRAQATPVPAAGPRTHIVRAGESLQEIGKLYGMDWQVLAAANQIANPHLIRVGQALHVPDAAEIANLQPSLTLPASQPRSSRANFRIAIARHGDDLHAMAARFGADATQMTRINGFGDSRLFAGDVVLLPPSEIAPTIQPATSPDSATRHVVRPGETLAGIAALYGRGLWDIARANNLPNPDRIRVGQILIIP